MYQEEGSGLANIVDCVDASIQVLKDYIKSEKKAASNGIGNIMTNIAKTI